MTSFKVKGKKLALTEHFWEPGIVHALISFFFTDSSQEA